jgi:sporulation integral membrane protein YtvI
VWKKDTETLRRYLLICLITLVALSIAILLHRYALPLLADLLGFLGVVLFPFVFAWLAAVFTRPLVSFLCRRLRLPPSLAVLLTMIIGLGILALLFTALTMVIIEVAGQLTRYFSHQENMAAELLARLQLLLRQLNLDFAEPQTWAAAGNLAGQGLSLALNLVKATPALFLLILVTLVAIFYWCRDEEKVKRLLIAPFPPARRRALRDTYEAASQVTGNYLRAQLLLVGISTVLCMAGLALLSLPRALSLGLLAGGLDIIPMLGPGTVLLPWGLWLIFSGQRLMGVGLLVLLIVVIAARNIIEPKIVGDKVGLHPLAALAALFLGLKLFGLAGLFIGPVAAGLGIALYRKRRQDNTPLKTK